MGAVKMVRIGSALRANLLSVGFSKVAGDTYVRRVSPEVEHGIVVGEATGAMRGYLEVAAVARHCRTEQALAAILANSGLKEESNFIRHRRSWTIWNGLGLIQESRIDYQTAAYEFAMQRISIADAVTWLTDEASDVAGMFRLLQIRAGDSSQNGDCFSCLRMLILGLIVEGATNENFVGHLLPCKRNPRYSGLANLTPSIFSEIVKGVP